MYWIIVLSVLSRSVFSRKMRFIMLVKSIGVILYLVLGPSSECVPNVYFVMPERGGSGGIGEGSKGGEDISDGAEGESGESMSNVMDEMKDSVGNVSIPEASFCQNCTRMGWENSKCGMKMAVNSTLQLCCVQCGLGARGEVKTLTLSAGFDPVYAVIEWDNDWTGDTYALKLGVSYIVAGLLLFILAALGMAWRIVHPVVVKPVAKDNVNDAELANVIQIVMSHINRMMYTYWGGVSMVPSNGPYDKKMCIAGPDVESGGGGKMADVVELEDDATVLKGEKMGVRRGTVKKKLVGRLKKRWQGRRGESINVDKGMSDIVLSIGDVVEDSVERDNVDCNPYGPLKGTLV